MKRIVLLLTFCLFYMFSVQAQCPGCLLDSNFTVTPATQAITPDTMPDGIALQAYSEDVNFYLPAQFLHSSGLTVTMTKLEIIGVIGLPFGLQWQSSSPTNTWFPSQNPPSTEHGCGKICGTPMMAGDYVITVQVKAYVSTIMGAQTSDDAFTMPIRILPGSSANAGFSIVNPLGCAPIISTFSVNHPSNGIAGFSYAWNFGNGGQSNIESPPPVIYSNPGNYEVTLQTTIDTIPNWYLSSVNVLGVTACDDNPFSNVDLYIKISQGSTVLYQSAYVSNQNPPVSFSFAQLNLSNSTYTIEVWDDDQPTSADDLCGSVSFNGHATGVQTLSSGGLIVQFSITHPVLMFNDVDTIRVYPVPQAPIVTAQPNDSICAGNPITLWSSLTLNNQWYMNDSLMYADTLVSHLTNVSGSFKSVITNQYGCSSFSNIVNTVAIAQPITPSFWISGNNMMTLTSPGPNSWLQWYYLNAGQGELIAGANLNTFTATHSGNYFLVVSNSFGCSASSDTVFMTWVDAINDLDLVSNLLIYPNPADDEVHISFNNDGNINNLRLYDFTGKLLLDENISKDNSFIERNIDVSHYAKGTYLIQINGNKGNLNKKLIIR